MGPGKGKGAENRCHEPLLSLTKHSLALYSNDLDNWPLIFPPFVMQSPALSPQFPEINFPEEFPALNSCFEKKQKLALSPLCLCEMNLHVGSRHKALHSVNAEQRQAQLSTCSRSLGNRGVGCGGTQECAVQSPFFPFTLLPSFLPLHWSACSPCPISLLNGAVLKNE